MTAKIHEISIKGVGVQGTGVHRQNAIPDLKTQDLVLENHQVQ